MIQLYIALAVLAICIYFKFKYSYWSRRNVKQVPPVPIFGNLFDYVVTKQRHFGEIWAEVYNSYPKARYVGVYKVEGPALLIRDLDLVKDILVTKFNTFNKNEFALDPEIDPLVSVNPFLIPGDEWKKTRGQLSPLFLPRRILIAIPLINNVCKTMIEYIECGPESSNSEFDVKDLAAKFTTDVVAAVAFSLDGQSFTNPNADLRRIGDEIFKPTFIVGLKQQISLFMPFMAKILRVGFVSKEIDAKFRAIIDQLLQNREVDEKDVKRDDLFQVLMGLREKYGKTEFSDGIMAGHSMTFLSEGYETSSTTMSFGMYELAVNPEVQQTAQEEVDRVLDETKGEITDEVLAKLEYLEQCIMETVRFHCPVFHLSKVSLSETEFPPQFEDETKSLTVEKDTNVIIPVYAIHFDKDYYADPHRFDPTRWSKENRDAIPKYAFLGFGEGPRICLGMKFAIAQVKGGLASILYRYNIVTCDQTQIPLEFSKATFNLQPANGIYLKLEKRQKGGN